MFPLSETGLLSWTHPKQRNEERVRIGKKEDAVLAGVLAGDPGAGSLVAVTGVTDRSVRALGIGDPQVANAVTLAAGSNARPSCFSDYLRDGWLRANPNGATMFSRSPSGHMGILKDMEFTFLQNRLIVGCFSGIIGGILALLIQRILNKRGLFTYFVSHNRVSVSTDDAIFGTVRATWNYHPVDNLYSSSVELRNESLKDYENVTVKVFTNDSVLLTEGTEIVGTTRILEWTKEFAHSLAVAPGGQPTEAQRSLYAHKREYLIPTMNRGQLVRFTYLNTTSGAQPPTIWLDILHKGVKIKFRVAQPEFLGVPQYSAAQVGSVLGIVVVALVIATVQTVWIAAVLSFLFGLLVLLPGAASIKIWHKIRDLFGG